jgi:hypothetical protein
VITLLSAASVVGLLAGGAAPLAPRLAYEIRNLPPGYATDGLEVAEVQFYASANGANLAPQAVASASESAVGYPASAFNDGDATSFWTGSDNQANTRAVSLRLVFPNAVGLHHISLLRPYRGDYKFFRQLEVWSTNTPDDAASWVRVYHSELLDVLGAFQFYASNRKYYLSWTDGGNDYSSLVNIGLLDDGGLNHAGTGADIGTWEASSMDGRIYGTEGTANINSGDPLDAAWSCRGGTGLLAHSCKVDFDCSMVDLKAKDGSHHNASDAPAQTPLTLTVSVSKDGGVTRQPLWTCGSSRQFVANETRRFYHPKFLSRLRFVFGGPISDANGFCSLASMVLRDSSGASMNGKLVSVTASSIYNRNFHPVFLNDGDASSAWATAQGAGLGSWLEFAFLKADLADLASIDIQAISQFPGQTPSSIRTLIDTGDGFAPLDGAAWVGYPGFVTTETRNFVVVPNKTLYLLSMGTAQADQLSGFAEFDLLDANGSLRSQFIGLVANNSYSADFPASNAVDGNLATDWAGTASYNGNSQFAFRLPKTVVPVSFRLTARANVPGSMPSSFTLTDFAAQKQVLDARNYPAFSANETRVLPGT